MREAGPSEASRGARLLGFYLYLVVALALPSQWLFWDDLGFLLAARAGELDYGHLLWIPALRAAQWLLRPLTEAEEYASKLLAMLGGALAFVLLWARIERARLPRVAAACVTLLVTATPLFWRQLSVIEPTTWTLALLLVCADAAEAWGRARGARRLAWLCLAFALALGMHVVSLCALPWLLWLARGPAPRPRARELLVPAALVLGLLGAAALAGDPFARAGRLARYWAAFLPREDAPSTLATLWTYARSGFPLLLVALLLALASLATARWRGARGEPGLRGDALSPLALALPYLACFLAFGKPVVALLVPLTLAAGLVVAAGARAALALAPRIAVPLVATLVAAQGFVATAFALHHAATPDQAREAALLLAGALPPRALLVAGELANHVRWHTGAPVLPLPNLLHGAAAHGETARTPLELLRARAEEELARYDEVWLSSDAVAYAHALWGVPPDVLEALADRTLAVRAEPPLFLLRIAGGAR